MDEPIANVSKKLTQKKEKKTIYYYFQRFCDYSIRA